MGSLPPLTADAIALTEKKMDMTLDDIIKMSKKTKPKIRKQRNSNKSQWPFPNKFGSRDVASKAHVQQSVAARSSALRQAKLAEMRSRNGNNQFPAAKEAARRVAVARSVQWNKRRNGAFSVPINRPLTMVSPSKVNGPVKQRPQTLDSLFANMKEQRLRAQSQASGRQNGGRPNGVRQNGGRPNGVRQTIGRQNSGGRQILGGRQNGGRQTGGRPTNFANKQMNFGNRQGNYGGYQRNFLPHQRSN